MPISFNDFFTLMEKELLQESEAGDATDAESYKAVPKVMCKVYLNESMQELVYENPELFRKIIKHTFPSNAKYYSMPSNVAQLISYIDGNSWTVPTDSSGATDAIIAVEENKLYNSDGWEEGDVFTYDAIVFPDQVIDDTDVVNWKDQYMRLLRLNIALKSLARKGKAAPDYMNFEYQSHLITFRNAKPTIVRQRMLSFQGYSLGRR